MKADSEKLSELATYVRTTEEQFRTIFEHSAAGIALVDLQGRYLLVNPAYPEIFGYTASEFTQADFLLLTHPDDAERSRRVMQEVVEARGKRIRFSKRYLHKDGHTIWAELCSTLMYSPTGEPSHFITHLIDVTDRELARRALEAETERLAVTLRSIGDGVITTDLDGTVCILNDAAKRLIGLSGDRALGRPIDSVLVLIDEHTRARCECPVKALIRTQESAEDWAQRLLVASDGTERVVTYQCTPISDSQGRMSGVVLVLRDVTERQKLLEAAQRAQRLESVGVLAGGIAHDFNNLLAGLFGYVDLAFDAAEDPQSVREFLGNAQRVMGRARALTTQLLTFAKGGNPAKKNVELSALLDETARFAMSGSEIQLKLDLAPELDVVYADPNQLAQVIDNLLINARQAMPDGGQIEISAVNIPAGSPLPAGLRPGRHVRISVTDTGTGIPSAIRSRIFEPFFTTKHLGNGLGLAGAHSIVAKHGGVIEVESNVGKGSTFCVWLPSGSTSEVVPSRGSGRPHFRDCKVLVLDDEDYLRKMAAEMLTRLGCSVHTARDGFEAIQWWKRATNAGWRFDLVLLDLTNVGGMGGRQTLCELLALDPSVVAVAVSGYSEDPIMDRPTEFGFVASVRKPFILDELADTLQQALRRPTDTHPSDEL